MCGRYAITVKDSVIAEHFRATQGSYEFGPSYNIAPTQQVPIVLKQDGERSLQSAKWGLLPAWILLAKSVTPSAERSAMSASGL